MPRTEIYSSFAARFISPEKAKFASEAEIQNAEAKLNIRFPRSFRAFISEFGAPFTPGILAMVVDQSVSLPALQQFLHITEVAEATFTYRSGGMPDDLVCIASDAMGNMFCFSKNDLALELDDAPVYFFDHDFPGDASEELEIYPAFDAFLLSYIDNIK